MTTTQAPKDVAAKALYAVLGAPVVTGRKMRELGRRFATETAAAVDEWAAAGEDVAQRLADRKVVEQVQTKVDVEQLQAQVERLRDQLEHVLVSWRENFAPAARGVVRRVPVEKAEPEPTAEAPTGTKAEAPAAKKTTGKATAKKATAKKTTAKKTTAKARTAKSTDSPE